MWVIGRWKTQEQAPPERTHQMAMSLCAQDRHQSGNRIARFFGISGGAEPRAGRPRKDRKRQFLGLEEMEGRTMMSNIPVFTSVQVPTSGSTVLPLAPMEKSVANVTLLPAQTYSRGVQANLTAGVLYTVSDNVQSPYYSGYPVSSAPSLLQVFGPDGSAVTFHSTYPGSTFDPQTGQLTNDNTVIFRAPTTGLYTFGVGTKAALASYSVTVRPITLDNSGLAPMQNASDAAKLSFQGGGLYAYLDPTNTVLTLDGPTGRGFQIGGHFTETTTTPLNNNLSTSTITATGTVTLESALGNIPLPLPPGAQLVVSTTANGYNGLFGEVSSAEIQFPYQSLVSTLVSPFDSTLGNYANVANQALSYLGTDTAIAGPSINLGVGLGAAIQSLDSSAPVNPAVPYLYFVAQTGIQAQAGQVNVSYGAYTGSIVVDPADPSLYVHVAGTPVVADVSFGISQHGYIPFTPLNAPSGFQGQTLYGDVFFSGTLDLNALTEDLVPLTVTGTYDINFNTQGSWTSAVQQEVTDVFNGHPYLPNPNNMAIGLNGSLGVSLGFGSVGSVSLPLSAGSVIFSGLQQATYFAGGTVNPLANTPLWFLDSGANASVDGYLKENGQFDLKLQANYSVMGFQVASGHLDISNSGVYATGQMSILGSQVSIGGWFNYNGNFDVWGDVAFNYYTDLTGGSGFGLSGGVNTDLHFDINQTGMVQFSAYGEVYGNFWWFGQSVFSYDQYNSFGFSVDLTQVNITTGVQQALLNELESLV
jgi:hypothetical protein